MKQLEAVKQSEDIP